MKICVAGVAEAKNWRFAAVNRPAGMCSKLLRTAEHRRFLREKQRPVCLHLLCVCNAAFVHLFRHLQTPCNDCTFALCI